jgi:hypothetical protein
MARWLGSESTAALREDLRRRGWLGFEVSGVRWIDGGFGELGSFFLCGRLVSFLSFSFLFQFSSWLGWIEDGGFWARWKYELAMVW